MWFLGALLGLVVGGAIGGPGGAFALAILGGVAGAVFKSIQNESPAKLSIDNRVAHLERRVTDLSLAIEQLTRRLGGSAAKSAAEPEPTPAVSPETPTASEQFPHVEPPPQPAAMRTAVAAPPQSTTVAASAVTIVTRSAPEVAASQAPPREPAVTAAAEPPFWWKWLFGGNTLVRVGIVILFIGMAFLVKYAAEHAHFPIELRLASVAAGAIAMLIIGWRLRETKPGYALSMQGGGVGLLYLTVFAAMRLYSLLPPTLAFGLLVGIVVASVLLAVRQDAIALAMAATAGGFLAPILTSTGQGNHVMLFSYYVVLNLGVFAIAWTKAWRPLNLLGFVFTFVIGALWGWKNYGPEHFSTTEPFLAIFFLLYLGIALLYALRRSLVVNDYVDGMLVFGTPIAGFGLQSQLMKETEYGLALSALALGMLYILLASALWKRRERGMLLLVESYLALGVAFATLALPLALDGRWTSAAWAMEGAAVLWVGSRQERKLAQWFGALLQFAAGVAFFYDGNALVAATTPVFNASCLGAALVAASGTFCAYRVRTHGKSFAELAVPVSGFLFFWGWAWWVGKGLHEIDLFVHAPFIASAMLGFVAATAAGYAILHARLNWPITLVPQCLLLPGMIVLALRTVVVSAHPFANYGWAAWPVSFAVLLWILRRHEDELPKAVASLMHVFGLWLVTALACWEVAYWFDEAAGGDEHTGGLSWRYVAWAVVPGLVLAGIARFCERIGWPIAKRMEVYVQVAATPIAAYLFGWIFFSNAMSDGNAAPLPYVPILNPIDVAIMLILLSLAAWYHKLRALNLAQNLSPEGANAIIGIGAFAWVNGTLLRTIHHWAGVPYNREAMFHSMLAQTSISVFWTLIGCGLMLFATRRALRPLWMVGAGLLGVVVLKLFVVDLSNVSGIERIVSFIGVGVLLLAIGYFSPVPPSHPQRAEGEAS